MPSLEFTLLVDAVKLPSSASPSPHTTFEIAWFFSDQHQGRSESEVAVRDEVEFMMSAKWLIENRSAVGRVLQMSLLQSAPGAEQEMIGLLMIDLNAHIPKPPQRYSRQRATLTMSRCPFDQPVMIRLTIECVHSQLSVAPGPTPPPTTRVVAQSASQRCSSTTSSATASPPPQEPSQRGRSQTRTVALPPQVGQGPAALPIEHDADARPPPTGSTELDRLRSTVSVLTAANEQLRDENLVLRRAASQARKEPDYTTTVSRPSGTQSPPPSADVAPALDRLRAENATQRAEMAVLQRGVLASKEQLKAQLAREQELRAEISSLTSESAFQRDTIRQLEQQLEDARMRPVTAADARGGEVETLRAHLHNAQQAVRDLSASNHANQRTIDSLRTQLEESQTSALENERRLKDSEAQSKSHLQELQSKADRCEAALRLGQKEIVRLHKYCEDANERCRALVKVIDSQKVDLERKKKKLADMRAFVAAQATFGSRK